MVDSLSLPSSSSSSTSISEISYDSDSCYGSCVRPCSVSRIYSEEEEEDATTVMNDNNNNNNDDDYNDDDDDFHDAETIILDSPPPPPPPPADSKRLLKCEIEWPKCSYGKRSRRGITSATTSSSSKERVRAFLSRLSGWHVYPSIAVDGMNGTGKSTLAANLAHRHYLKINELVPHVTCGSRYNFDPLRSLEYMMLQQCIDTGKERVCWDRCRYSNLIFYYVHHLMYEYRDGELPPPSSTMTTTIPSCVIRALNELAQDTNLLETLTLLENDRPDHMPTFFLVCSDPCAVGRAMIHRATAATKSTHNDVYNAKEYNYQLAQYYAYTYFAQILDYPCLDLMDAIRANYTFADLQSAIRVRIDLVGGGGGGDGDDTASTLQMPHGMEEARALANRLGDSVLRETLVYTYSRK